MPEFRVPRVFQCSISFPAHRHISATQHLNIQDFRSNEGIYTRTGALDQTQNIKIHDLFHMDVFKDSVSTAQFYRFIAEMKIKVDAASPSPTHRFIQRLDNEGKLIRWYTQNVDGLEWKVFLEGKEDASRTPIPDSCTITRTTKIIRLHGDIKLVPHTGQKSVVGFPFCGLLVCEAGWSALVVEKGSLAGLNT